MSVKIIIDSTADTTAAVRARCGVVPLTIRFGEEDFIDGETITHQEFYEKLVQSDVLPTTSQPTPAAFADAFDQEVQQGNQVVMVTISSKLSGTYQSACIAAMDYEDQVFVVDSRSAALGAGILAARALELADQDLSAAEIAGLLKQERDRVTLVAVIDTLEYLKKGGRISKTAAFAGELLSIKPIISVPEGEISVIGKARGAKQGNAMLIKRIEEDCPDLTKPYLLAYAGTSDAPLKKFTEDSAHLWNCASGEYPTTLIGSVIGTHIGPGAVAVAYFKK